jgi:hypothetical protein
MLRQQNPFATRFQALNPATQESANTLIYSHLLQPKKQPAERL